MGAKVVTSVMDILEDLVPYATKDSGQMTFSGILPYDEQLIYDLIDLSPKHIEELMVLTEFDIGKLTEHLLSLEFKDLIYQPMKNYYIRRRF